MPYSTQIFMWQCRNGVIVRRRKRHRVVLPNIYVVPPAGFFPQVASASPHVTLSASRPGAPAQPVAEFHAA